jgi:hypothetical protein
MSVPPMKLDPADERRLAAAIFNQVWDLLEKPDRAKVAGHVALAQADAARITDAGDRAVLTADLASLT